MDRFYQIIGVIVRIAAIFIAIRTISYFPSWYAGTSYESTEAEVYIFIVLYSLIMLGIAFVLWKFPLLISRKLVPEIKSNDIFSDIPFRQVQVGLLSVLGVGIVVFNLSDLLYWYTYIQTIKSNSDPGFPIGPSVYASLYSTVLELILGIALILGSKGIVGLIYKFRYAGSSDK